MSTFETNDHTPESQARWRWISAALAPGLFSIALFAGYMLSWLARRGHPKAKLAIEIGMAVLYAAMFMPFSFLPYVYLVGRRYTRVIHGGHKPVLPFVLGYGLLNLLLWGAAALVLLANMGGR